MRRIAMVLVLVGGCGSSSEDDGCDPAEDRVGSYLFTMTQTGGNCGPVLPVVITLPAIIEPNCELLMQTWSPDMCSNATHSRCNYEDEMGPWWMEFSGVVTQDDSDGERLLGSMELGQFEDSGTICQGTYDVEYERQ
jgi:hypothetical protein